MSRGAQMCVFSNKNDLEDTLNMGPDTILFLGRGSWIYKTFCWCLNSEEAIWRCEG